MSRPELTEAARRLLQALQEEQVHDTSPPMDEIYDLWFGTQGQHLQCSYRYNTAWGVVKNVVGKDGVRFGDRRLMTLTSKIVEEVRDKLKATPTRYRRPSAPATRNQSIGLISRLCNFAVDQEIVTRSPIRIKLESADNIRQTPIRGETEYRLLYDACDRLNKALVTLLYDSGMRQGEAISLRRDQVSYAPDGTPVASLVQTKGHKARIVPLTKRIMEELEKLPDEGVYYFARPGYNRPYAQSTLYKKFQLAVARAGFPPLEIGSSVHYHDSRHAFALVRIRDDNWTGKILMSVMGHASQAMLERYGTLDMWDAIGAMKGVEERMSRLPPRRADSALDVAELQEKQKSSCNLT